MSYTGGLIGLFSSRTARLQDTIQRHNNKGYRLRHVLPGKAGLSAMFFQFFCLAITLLLWAPEPGETLVFERVRP